jgi:hypothetical protein
MKYLKNYNESKSSSEMKLNDIKNMFIYFYDNTKYSISVVKLKDSDLDQTRSTPHTYKDQYSALNVFNYYVGRPKFKVNIKSVTRLDKKVLNSALETFEISDIYDELKFIEEYLPTRDISIKYLEVYHIIKMPKIYSSTHATTYSYITNDSYYISNTLNYSIPKKYIVEEGSIIEKSMGIKNIKSIELILF